MLNAGALKRGFTELSVYASVFVPYAIDYVFF